MLSIEEKRARLKKRLDNYSPDELYNKLKSYSQDGIDNGIPAASFIGRPIFNTVNIKWNTVTDTLHNDFIEDYSLIGLLCEELVIAKHKESFNTISANDETYAIYFDDDCYDEVA